MAVILSTKTGGQLTSAQARALNKALSSYNDVVIDDFGNELASSYAGWVLTIGTGALLTDGALLVNDSQASVTIPTPSSSGTGMLIAKVNLSTGVASIEFKTGTTLTQNNLIANETGTREVELYRISYTTSSITGFVDYRSIKNDATLLAKVNEIVGTGAYILRDINIYNNTGTQALSNAVADNLNLTKLVGDLPVSSGYNIILYKGFYYELDYAINITANPTSTTALAEATINATGATVYGVRASVRTFNSSYGAGDNVPGSAVIDLTSAGSDAIIRLRASLVEGNSTVRAGTWLKIKKYKKVV